MAGLLLLFLTAGTAPAAIRRVAPGAPGPAHDGTSWATAYTTLASALSAAAAGDEIWVATATYTERITLPSGVALYGGFAGTEAARADRNPQTNVATIDGTNGTTVTVANGATAATILDGVTVLHGSPGVNMQSGAAKLAGCIVTQCAQGITYSGGTPAITGCVIQANNNSGILGTAGVATITGNTLTNNRDFGVRADGAPAAITGNTITGSGAGAGTGTAAIMCNLDAGAAPNISGNTLTNNNGSGVSTTGGAPKIKNNVIKGNTGTQGGGVFCSGGTPVIADNVMALNSSFQEGGGIYAKNANATITNNTLAGNSSGGQGGAVYLEGGTLTIVNNIFAYNAPGLFVLSATVSLRKNCVFGNLVYAYAGVTAGATDITADPQIAGPVSRDLHIQPTSPCRNAGENTVVVAGDTDMDGQPRIQPAGGTVDIGADESDGTVYNIPTPILYVKPAAQGGDDANNGLSWANAKATVQAGINAAAGGGEVWVQTGSYVEQLTLKNGVSMYGGFAGIETTKGERTGKFLTVLDGGASDTVITIPIGVGAPETIDGFQITNGKAHGIVMNLAGVDITNNTFFSNGSNSNSNDAIRATSSAVNLRNNTLRDNNGYGLVAYTSTVSATGNTIKTNSGGGIWLGTSSNLTADTNTITGNGREAIYGDSGIATVAHNTIANNGYGVGWNGNLKADTNTITGNNNYAISGTGTIVALHNTLTGNASGISCNGTLTADSNTVSGSGAAYGYGAIHCSGTATITNNTVTGNSTTGIIWGQNGTTTATITGNTVSGNTGGPNSNNGGGIWVSGGAPNVQNNVVSGNSANYGGGIFANNITGTIANNVILSNGVPYDGAGIYVSQGTPNIINNTISGNSAPGLGGGIAVSNARPTIANNLVVYNTSGVSRTANSTLNYSHNDVWNNSGTDYQGFPVSPTGTNGNISVDPQLGRAPVRDVHIKPASPARNAGDNTVLGTGWLDMDGQARTQGGTVDIGADESYDEPRTGVGAPVYFVSTTAGDDGNDGTAWSKAKKTIQAGINAAAGGAQVWVAAGTYKEKITLAPGVLLFGGFAGAETVISQRDYVNNLTVLDAQMTGDVITVPSGTGATVRVDGFTIGNRTTGSTSTGVVLADSALVLANDIITLNRTGLRSAGSVLTLTRCSFPDNDQVAIDCSANTALTISDSTVSGNGQHAVNGDSGTLVASGNTISGNGWGGFTWTGTSTLTNNTVRNNGYGINLSGTIVVTGNTVQGNSNVFSTPAISAEGYVTIDQNSVLNNGATGISARASQPVLTGYTAVVTHNTVSGNSVNNAVAGVYIRITGSASGLVADNTITGNANTNSNGSGGGLYVDGSAPEIQRNVIAENIAGYGGGVYLNKCQALVANNFISGNTANNNGGGVYLYQGQPSIINNSVAANSAGANGQGGGLYADATTAVIANTIIAFNTSGGLFKSTTSSLNLSHNDAFGNLPEDYTGYATSPTGTNGNISLDPHMVQPSARNLHIQETSPAINAGDNTVLIAGWTDIDGQPRVWPTTAGVVDIGADESKGEHYTITPLVIRVNGATGDDADDGSTWAKAKRTIQAAIDSARGGGEIWVAGSNASPPAPYQERLTVRSGIALYGGFAGTETARSARDWNANPTIIDGQNGGDVVTVPSSAGSLEVIDGFTIGNKTTGSTSAGIAVANASLVVANCSLTLNRYGIWTSSALISVANSTLSNNNMHGVMCTLNSSLSLDTVTLKNNGQMGITSDSGTLTATNITSQDNGWGGLDWENGTSTVTGSVFQRNNYGVYLTGTISFTHNVVQGNARQFSLAAVTANGFSTVSNNQILNNSTTALSCTGLNPVLTGYTVNILDNVISNNTVDNAVAGVYCKLQDTATAIIQRNTITNNSNTNLGGSGGGMYLDGGAPLVMNNVVQGNGAGWGAGVYGNNTNATLANNQIVSNGVNNSGGGLYLYKGSPKVYNNTITANSASGDGGGIYADASAVTLTNTIVAFNAPGIAKNTAASLTMSHNDVYGNTEYNASGFVLTDNLNVDPGLASAPARNVHIRLDSPLRNAGDNSVVPTTPPLWQDMDGQNRIQNTTVDIGADESDGTAYPTQPVIIRVNAAGGNDANDGSTWAKAKQTIQAGVTAAAGGGEVWVAGGTYHELVIMKTAVALFGGFAGTETARTQRNPTVNTTVIDGDNAGTVVTVPNGTGATGTIDGFTIRDSAGNAYGLYAVNTALNLAGVTLTNNNYGMAASGCLLNLTNVSVSSGAGRGIQVGANTTIAGTNVSVSGNAQEGIYADTGTLDITGLTVANNAYGGIYWPAGTLTLRQSRITGNGYGLSAAGTITITDSVIQGNGSRYNNAAADVRGFVTMRNNVITANAGTGISAQGDLPVLTGYTVTLTDNTITGNIGQNAPGGIYVRTNGTASTLVQGNAILGNANTNGAGTGGGLYLDQGQPIALNNYVVGNGGGAGAGIYLRQTNATLANNLVTDNTTGQSGGGVYLYQGQPTLINNTIASNTAGAAANGGGVNVEDSTATLAGNIIAFNASGVNKTAAATVTMRNNDVFGNTDYQYKGMPDPLGTNIKVDPLFFNVSARNYHLKAGSPVIDQGDDTVIDAAWKDMDGQNRKQGTHVDMGADEYNGVGAIAIQYVTQPSGARAGVPFTTQPVVRAVDAAGNTSTTFTGPISLSIKPSTGTAGAGVVGTSTKNAVAGVAAFTNVGIDKVGTGYVLVATNPGFGFVESAPFDVQIGAFTLSELVSAMKIAAGIQKATSADIGRLDVVTGTGTTGRITAEDVSRLARKVAGKDANP